MAPVSVTVWAVASFCVSVPVPEMTPEKATSAASFRTTAPLLTILPCTVPSAAPSPSCSVLPAPMAVPPVYVLAPTITKVPGPATVSLPEPVTGWVISKVTVVSVFTVPPPAPSTMARPEVRLAATSSVPDVVASPSVRPPAGSPSSPSTSMMTVLPPLTTVPPV